MIERFFQPLLRRITMVTPAIIEYLSNRSPQLLGELLVPPTNDGELIAAVVWFVLMLFAPPS